MIDLETIEFTKVEQIEIKSVTIDMFGLVRGILKRRRDKRHPEHSLHQELIDLNILLHLKEAINDVCDQALKQIIKTNQEGKEEF